MATKTASKKNASVPADEAIVTAFVQHVLEHGTKPASVWKLAHQVGLTETEFYQHFSSLDHLEGAIWLHWHKTTLARLEADDAYLAYSVREKWLAYFFTLIEEWKANRSYILATYKAGNAINVLNCGPELKAWKEAFQDYAKERVTEGTDTGEVASRSILVDRYKHGYWLQAIFLLDFWLKDTSKNFELTDAAVEKAVNLGMDLVSNNALDTAFDFAKFIWQNR